jgi:hypothetical protein
MEGWPPEGGGEAANTLNKQPWKNKACYETINSASDFSALYINIYGGRVF